MFIFSINLPKTRIITIIAIVLCLICVLFLILKIVPCLFATNTNDLLQVQNYEDMVQFFKSYGYTVSQEPIETEDVVIPETFDPVYVNYEKLQKEAGFSIEGFKGVHVKRYTFLIENHERSVDEQVRGNLLVYEDRIIGGDICSVALDGFMSPLVKKN